MKLSHGVVLVSGAFSNRGGSHNNPRITDWGSEDPVLEVRDLPASALKLLHPDEYELVDSDPLDALSEERTRLLERLKEIDEQIAKMERKTIK